MKLSKRILTGVAAVVIVFGAASPAFATKTDDFLNCTDTFENCCKKVGGSYYRDADGSQLCVIEEDPEPQGSTRPQNVRAGGNYDVKDPGPSKQSPSRQGQTTAPRSTQRSQG